MKTRSILVLLFVHFQFFALSQQSELNREIESKIRDIYKNAQILHIEEKINFTEVEFICKNELIEAGFDEKLNLIYTEKEISVPENVLSIMVKKLDKAYSGWKLDEILLVNTGDTTFYNVELLKNGIEANVYFTSDGKYYRPFNLAASDLWTKEMLETDFSIKRFSYNFLKPAKIFDLPDILREISGIAVSSADEIYCIQDEAGILFSYNLLTEKISEMLRFTDTGDFEDITIGAGGVLLLRSDGTVFNFNPKTFNGTPKQTIVPTQSMNIEGLFLDRKNEILLVASKSEPVNGAKNIREIHQTSPGKMFDSSVFLKIDIDEINGLLKKTHPGLMEETTVEFNPSAIAIHPVTGELYILSASDRLLAVFKNKQLKQVIPLPSEIFYKPEGLSFSPNGDMFISSEGIKNGALPGRIFYIPYKPEIIN